MGFEWNNIDEENNLNIFKKTPESTLDTSDVINEDVGCNSFFGVYNPLCPSPKSEERAQIMAKNFNQFIYLDNNATHPLLDSVRDKMNEMAKLIGNGSSDHEAGVKVRAFIEESRQNIADFLKIEDPSKLIFGGCGSEMNNMVIKGVAFNNLNSEKNEIIISNIEHKSILKSAKYLEKFGFKIKIAKANNFGAVPFTEIIPLVNEKTLLISIIHANNELGTVNNINMFAKHIKEKYPNILIHSDKSQSIGKTKNPYTDYLDFVTYTAHKFGGPVGIGALYIKDFNTIDSLIHGGNQEFKKRAGTYNQIQIFGMSKAILEIKDSDYDYVLKLKNYLIDELKKIDKQIKFNCDYSKNNNNNNYEYIPQYMSNTVSVKFNFQVEELIKFLSENGIFVSTSSACNSREKNPSYILKAIGLSDEESYSTIRISLSKLNTKDDIDYFIKNLNDFIKTS